MSLPWISGLNAQLCQGSLGDPLVNITFGAGTNPGPALKAATTSYQYQISDCPQDGYYSVRNSSNSCFNNSWHTLTSDHTGDPNGYFMLVNASFQPSAFYLDTVKGLCGGTTYEFAAWIINVLKSTACGVNATQPNLTFTLENSDGSLLKSYNTNTLSLQSSPVWQQFGFFFTTPSNVSEVVLRIFNNAPGGCGNDLALDDITFRPCGPKLTPSITGFTTTEASICEGEDRSFEFTCSVSAGFNNPSFLWQQSMDGVFWSDIPGATTTRFTQNFNANMALGNYHYRLSSAESGNMNAIQCRIVSIPLTIKVSGNPKTTVGSNSPICENGNLVLGATGGVSYQWNGNNNFSASGSSITINNAKLTQSGKYYVLVTSDAGCKQLDSVSVVVNPAPRAGTSFSVANICEGDRVQLESSGGIDYQWVPATGLSAANISNPVASPELTTPYNVIVSNQFACRDTAQLVISVVMAPTANAGPDKWIIKGNSVQLSASAEGLNAVYLWFPDAFINSTRFLQPEVSPPQDTSYILKVISNDGCGTAMDTVRVFVYKDVFVPGAFSPNDDGLNDTWNIPALAAYPEFELTVYSRAGLVVFQNKNNNRPWNGKYKGNLLPVGIYVYVINLKTGGEIIKGTVALLR